MLTFSESCAKMSFRLARIFRSYAIMAFVVFMTMYLAPLISILATLFIMLILALVVVCTFFLIFLSPTFREIAGNTTELTNNFVDFCLQLPQYTVYVAIAATVFALLAFIAAFFDKSNYKRKGMLISCGVFFGISAVFSVVLMYHYF